MYFHSNNDKDNPVQSGQSFDDLMNDWDDNTFFGASHSLPSHPYQLETTPSPKQQWQNNMDDYSTVNPSVFLDTSNLMSSQDLDLILSSDPTFMRQQQLFQEQQQQQQPSRSNLSSMLSENDNRIQPINLITSQQQSQNILNRRLSNQTEPIPIASSTNNTTSIITTASPDFTNSVDHQRRFNELQARFRVNYVKRSKQQQQQTKPSLGSSMPNTLNEKPYIMDKRRLSFDPTGNKLALKLNSSNKTTKSKQINIPNTTTASSTTASSPLSSSFPSRTMPIQIQRQHRLSSLQNLDLEAKQKKLDDQLIKADFDDITVSELKEMLRQRGKHATGKKAVLLQRLQEERDMIVHARVNGISILSRNADQAASSLPETVLSSSPSGGIGSLNRSIADMHIGSPPVQQSRRFAPYYGTSPRSSAMNLAPNNNSSSLFYSSSMPTGSLDQSGLKKSYLPFESSALATPDQEKRTDPFDSQDIKEEYNDMDWTNPNAESLLSQDPDLHDKTTEELLALLANQELPTDGMIDFNDLQFDISELSNAMYDSGMDLNTSK